MVILGKSISKKTASIISTIESTLKKPVQYHFTDPIKTSSFGRTDPWRKEAYYVYCKESLLNITKQKQTNTPFETNLLHELSHLCQIEEGFPHTRTIKNLQTLENMEFYASIGTLVSSMVLDLNVDLRLQSEGYSSEYFYKYRLNRARKIALKKSDYSSPVAFVQMATQLIGLKLLYPSPETDNVISLYQQISPALSNCVNTVSDHMLKIGWNDAKSTFNLLALLCSAFNLWITHAIIFQGKEYCSNSMVEKDFPEMRMYRL